MDGWMKWMYKRIDVYLDEALDEWIDGWMDGWLTI